MRLTERNENTFPHFDELDSFDKAVGVAQTKMTDDRVLKYDDCLPNSDRAGVVKSIFPVPEAHQAINLSGIILYKSEKSFYCTNTGVIITDCGEVLTSSYGEARYVTPTKAALPHVLIDDDGATFSPPEGLPYLSSGLVCVPLGATVNYGHFIFDCLPAMLACAAFCRANNVPILLTPLHPWQRRLVELLALDVDILEIRAPLVRLGVAYHTNVMDHFLRNPSYTMSSLADRQLSNARPYKNTSFGNRVFIERDDQIVRKFRQEKQLIAILQEYGFNAVKTETLEVDEEIQLAANADIIIGPAGAGFANALFCQEGTVVVEIMPTFLVGSVWVRNICALRKCFWIPIVIPSIAPNEVVTVEGEEKPAIGLTYDPNYDVNQIVEQLKPIFKTRRS